MKPEEILHSMSQVYAQCGTYRDTGQVQTTFHYSDDRPQRIVVNSFSTVFSRPDRLRFEFRQQRLSQGKWQSCVIWSHGMETLLYSEIDSSLQRVPELSLAVAGATGISSGAAFTVPSLLLPKEVRGRRLTDLEGISLLDDGCVKGVPCYRLQGSFPAGTRKGRESTRQVGDKPITMWIEKSSWLLRRVERESQFGTFRTKAVTNYDPAIDVVVGDEDFRPPQEGTA